MKTSKFQLIVLGTFVVFIIAGVAFFASFRGGGASANLPAITIWGTYPKSVFDGYVEKINQGLSQQISVTYVQEDQASFSHDFTSALAVGRGPDAILIPADMLLPEENKLALVPYSSLPQRTFMDAFIQEAGIYLSKNGILALPFSVDPLVTYWNRDMFNAAGLAQPPAYWDQFAALNKALTVSSQNGTISRSAVALGDFTNVDHAREIFGAMLMQSGDPVTTADSNGSVVSAIGPSTANSVTPALEFFAGFVDPSGKYYSWNGSWPDSKTAFLSGNLAVYFGPSSELSDIRSKNPNLNFDVAPFPEPRSGGKTADYGLMYGLSLVKSSQNLNAAYQTAAILTSPSSLALLSKMTYTPPVYRSLIAAGTNDPYMAIFDRAALVSQTWLDADPVKSSALFGSMVDSVVSGRQDAYQAVQDGGASYDVILRNAQSI